MGDLDGSQVLSRKGWTATVTIAVHDAHHVPVAGAVVTGRWSGGASGSGSYTTNVSGICAVSKKNLKLSVAGVTFTVTGVSKSGYAYLASANHDPDGDSNGTTITELR